MLLLDQVSFSYNDSKVIEDISFSVNQGEHLALIGESGSGKSTLLKLIYGLYDLDSGNISYDGRTILGPKHQLLPGDEKMKYLAQDFGLMPYITSAENVGEFLSNTDKYKKQQRIDALLEMVGMLDYANVKAHYLSGGEQQRIGLAKVLASEPEILLLDEPFSQIDSFRANSLRRKLFNYLKENSITCLIATHDSNDVLSFADKTVILKNGKIVDQGNSKILYKNPKSLYAASLFGEANEIRARHFSSGSDELLIVYPHQLKVADFGLQVTVKANYFRGSHYLIEAVYGDGRLFFESPNPYAIGTIATLALFQ